MNKPAFRQRPIDYAKPLQLIKEINEVKKTADQAEKEELTIMESELKKILELYDRKKSIIIPKTEKIDKPLNEKNDKAPAKKTPSASNKFDSGLEYKQNEFIRPEHYIIYSERSRIENHKRDYEASRHDANFLNYENNFMTLEELEIVISTLENDIGHGELIPRERISQLILSIYPDKADYVKKLTDFFLTRREDFKKSLLRKYWKEQKPSDKSDKYIQTTFRRRDREKMKTRRNKQNEFESLEKLKEIRDIMNTTLRSILNGMKQKEELKKHLIQVNQFAFETEILEQKAESIPKELEDKWRNKMLELSKIKLLSDEKPKKVPEHDSDSPSTRPKSNSEENIDPNIKSQTQPTRSLGRKTRISGIEPAASCCSSRERTTTQVKTIRTGRHTKTPKDEIGIKSLSLLPLKEQDKKEEEDNYLKLRLRVNRANQLVIDRYIQKNNSFSPFDDSLTKEISKFKLFNNDFVVHVDKGGNFDNLYNQYLKSSLNNYCLFSDSDDDSNLQNQVKSFQASHRQFLKQKRGHN